MFFTMLPMATETIKLELCDSLVYFLVFCREINPWQSFLLPDSNMHCKVKCYVILTCDVCWILKKTQQNPVRFRWGQI